MSDYETNPYFCPQAHGLEILHSFDDPQASYSFDMFVVWKHVDGRLFYATDSGCSCPSPFEGHAGPETLTQIASGDSFESFKRDFESWRKSHRWGEDDGYDMCSVSDAQTLFDDIAGRLAVRP
jgi:hypothetical protein